MPAGGGSSIKGGARPPFICRTERNAVSSKLFLDLPRAYAKTRTRTEYHADVAPCGAFSYLIMANKRVICSC